MNKFDETGSFVARDAAAELDFAPDDDKPIPYIERTRDWYLALGYGNPYRWAHYATVPFQQLTKPLAQCTVALVTTAAPYQPDKGPQGPSAPYNAAAKFYSVYSGDASSDHDVRIAHLSIDRKNTSMEDSNTWFPLPRLRELAQRGHIGALARRFHGMPTNRSQRRTLNVDCPELLARCLEDNVDAAVLVPNCPVCHQTLGLAARYLEEHGIATLIMACAKDVVEHCGVPRMLFSDFPLGNAAGKPHNPAALDFTLEYALRVLESAPGPRTTVQSPLRWSESHAWKADYGSVEGVSKEELARLRAENDRVKEIAKEIRDESLS